MKIVLILFYLVAVNLIAFVAFRVDKQRAIENEWRMSEGHLLALALFGGWGGAKLAQRRYRHKTRKQPFCAILNFVPMFWLATALLVLLLATFPQVPRLVASVLFEPEHSREHKSPTPKYFQRVNN